MVSRIVCIYFQILYIMLRSSLALIDVQLLSELVICAYATFSFIKDTGLLLKRVFI
jgi:hypothetical protein